MTDQAKKHQPFLSGVVEGFYGRPWTGKQRRTLLRKMSDFGLDAYMYAPKDDLKHRANWREAYSLDECLQLKDLIHEAKLSNVQFFYSLSPGLDMIYSDSNERKLLISKYKQVADLECENFAILFDDIEPHLCSVDREFYSSFAEAHVSVAHFVFQALGHPQFLFCPTQYCGSRAIPSVRESEYLSTIGKNLDFEIRILWTGPQVISSEIDVKSLIELESKIHRKPVIWDNISANDYDQRRIFLGPYNRDQSILNHISGVFTNPNCELEANFIGFDTLGAWLKSGRSAVPGEIFHAGVAPYRPQVALVESITKWVKEFNILRLDDEKPTVSGLPSNSVMQLPAATARAEEVREADSDSDYRNLAHAPDLCSMDFAAHPFVVKEAINTSTVAWQKTEIDRELQDFTMGQSINRDDLQNVQSEMLRKKDTLGWVETSGVFDKNADIRLITEKEIQLLVDLFYLPFEHGPRAQALLSSLTWLKQNAPLLKSKTHRRSGEHNWQTVNSETTGWKARARMFEEQCCEINDMCVRLANNTRNRLLLHELFPYFWDLKGIISQLRSFITWLGHSQGAAHFSRNLLEPWVSRGSLFSDIQHLLPSSADFSDFLHASSQSPTVYIVRPFLPEDKEPIYNLCREIYQTNDLPFLKETTDFIGDSTVGPLLHYFPEHTCILENERNEICGYVTGTDQPKKFVEEIQADWDRKMVQKYSKITEFSIGAKEALFAKLHYSDLSTVSAMSGLIQMALLPSVCDGVSSRLLACGLSASNLTSGAEIGAYINKDNWQMRSVYQTLGFKELSVSMEENSVIMIRQVP